MDNQLKKLVRECACEMTKDKSNDGYLVGMKMPDVSDSVTANKIGKELYSLGIIECGWCIVGRNRIQGQVNRDRLASFFMQNKSD